MPKPVIWSPLSENDLESILQYLQKNWDKKVALRFIEIVEQLLGQISDNPKQFPIIYKRSKVRKCVITKHNTMFYRERKDFVDILRIYDTRQDTNKLKFQ